MLTTAAGLTALEAQMNAVLMKLKKKSCVVGGRKAAPRIFTALPPCMCDLQAIRCIRVAGGEAQKNALAFLTTRPARYISTLKIVTKCLRLPPLF